MTATPRPAAAPAAPPRQALASSRPASPASEPPAAVSPTPAARPAVRRLLAVLLPATVLVLAAGLAAGSAGWAGFDPGSADWRLLVLEIRAPRTLGAWLAGALLGLAGALAQGLFRNPLADPYLLGSSSGAALGVALALLVAPAAAADGLPALLARAGLVGAAFAGALAAVVATVVLAGGAQQSVRLLLAGVVVSIVLAALTLLLIQLEPARLRSVQSFMLGTTGLLGWPACAVLAVALAVCALAGRAAARALDALALGEDTAASLGIGLPTLRRALVAAVALATAAAVAHTGLIAFVGLVAAHLVRQFGIARHAPLLLGAAATGGLLLAASDLAARLALPPQELPVGVLTALLGGGYLLALMWRRAP